MTYYFALVNNYYVNYLNLGRSTQLRLRDYKSEFHDRELKLEIKKAKLNINSYVYQMKMLQQLNQDTSSQYDKIHSKYSELKDEFFRLIRQQKHIKNYKMDCIVYSDKEISYLKKIHPNLETKIYKISNIES